MSKICEIFLSADVFTTKQNLRKHSTVLWKKKERHLVMINYFFSGKKHPGLGYQAGSGPTSNLASGQMQWTPEGWVQKDNSHKVTAKMRPLPKIQIVPPLSVTYPEAR